jgi:hypothetical protein
MADAKPKTRFSGRAFISLNTTISFIVLIVSSVVLYIIPPGRDAYWTNWSLWGLDKDQWGALHTVGGLAFVIFGIIHLIPYNWKVFWNYIISKIRKNLNKKAELAAAVVLNILIVLVCVFNWFPSSVIMNWSFSLKNGWVSTAQRAPYGHAEGETLEVLSGRLDFDLAAALRIFEGRGLKVDPAKTVLLNATENKMTPAEFFEVLSPLLPAGAAVAGGRGGGRGMAAAEGTEAKAGIPLQEGGGWGRKTVKMICEELGIDPAAAIAKLKAKGIEAKPESGLRELGAKVGLTPIQVAEIIRN